MECIPRAKTEAKIIESFCINKNRATNVNGGIALKIIINILKG